MDTKEIKHLRFNFFTNLMDGGFFGAALGFASFITVIPLFVSGLTDSALLIGLIPAIHAVGWQLPQLFTAKKVSSLRLLRPAVLSMTIHERLPFLGLAIVAWYSTSIGQQWALILTFLLLIWQGFGGGFTANPWQSMIGKIMPARRLGTFFGMQSATANIFASIAAVLAGIILDRTISPLDFTACFLFASVAMMISLVERIRNRHQVLIIEADHQDLHQRAGFAISALSTDPVDLESRLQRVEKTVHETWGGSVLAWDVEIIQV